MNWQRFSNPLSENPRSGEHRVGGLLVRSDQRWKDFTYGADVPEAIRKNEFDWLDDAEGSDHFFQHHGTWYHLSQFMRVETGGDLAKAGWEGYHSDSFSTGVVVKVSDDGDKYKVGTYRTAPGSNPLGANPRLVPMESGYAYKYEGKRNWFASSDERWEIVVVDGDPNARTLGFRTIDQTRMRVFSADGGPPHGRGIFAQTAVGPRAMGAGIS